MRGSNMKVLFVLFAIFFVISTALPQYNHQRFRKSQSQVAEDTNIQPFIRFRKALYGDWLQPMEMEQ
ncbi:unnamed protein product [Auanema sp. JU1783]|nr:unnamed protein product [Auanema sp. JU1783]